MVTKALVEEIISPYQVRIRIPVLDRTEDAPLSTDRESLNIATICCLPNCYMNMQVGDIVFVTFEDNTYYKAVILGHLCREAMSDTHSDVVFSSLKARFDAHLPKNTHIGDISPTEIERLHGVSENIQEQINALKDELKNLTALVTGGT